MRRNYLFILIIIFGETLLPSCEKDVTFDFDRPVKLSLNCILNPDSTITARLTLSGNIENNTSFQPVDDATIVLYENGIELGTLTSGSEGNYYLDYHPESQNEYKIAVLHPDYKDVTASTEVPQKPDVMFTPDTLELIEHPELYWLEINVVIHDLPGKNSYWLYGKRTMDGVVRTGGGFQNIKAPFIDDFNRRTDPESKFGYVYDYYVRISDIGYDGEKMTVMLEAATNGSINIVSADEHYDKYIKSSVKARLNSEGDLPFKEPVQIYSNIENGYGIFGACAITTIKL
ncbi:MAG: DUF4249 domain-containing protein [Prolixibacteraceae bacterium]|nr:DUF4249 domain-containing protein [Prolixibacteraceae bacterium]